MDGKFLSTLPNARQGRLEPGDDKQMILSPKLWPCHPYLPMKRRSNKEADGTECGVLYAGRRWVIYKTNLFMLPAAYAEFEAFDKYAYQTVEELLADGWIVD